MTDPRHHAGATLAGIQATANGVTGRFGTDVRDLDVDLGAPRPVAVTGVLARCYGGDADTWWALPIHRRIVALVSAAESATGRPIEVCATCACEEVAAIELTAAELAEFDLQRTGDRSTVEVGGVTLRLPTGRDQLAWIEMPEGDEIARAVLSQLVIGGGALPADLVVAAERALADADPLVDFHVETVCPGCGAELRAEVDLEAIAIGRLRRVQRTQIQQVHAIASVYHWSEDHIARLPEWRRAEYLALIGRGP